jgi:hypothetical protein
VKVGELIEHLRKFDQEMLLVVDGYEGGVESPLEPVLVEIKLDVNTAWYYGKHAVIHEDDAEKPDCKAVLLGR